MRSSNIPKEKLTAYERWELASFDPAPPPMPAAPEVSEPLYRGPTPEEIAAQEEELAARHREAEKLGYAAGYQDGLEQGLNEGRAAATLENGALRELLASLAAEIDGNRDRLAEELLDLALDIAKAVIKTELEARPALVLPVINEAIHYLPSMQQPATLHVHPDDAEIVRERMADELRQNGWHVSEDGNLTRGGCKVETPSNQIDASLEVRWQRIAAAFGRDLDWME